MFATLDYTRKNGPKIFVTVETAIFWNVCFYRRLGPKETISSFAQKNQNTLRTFIVCSMTFFMFDKTRKYRSKLFFYLKKFAFIWTLCVFNNLLGLEKCTYKFHSSYQFSLWTHIKNSLMFVTLNDTRKTGQKPLSSWQQLFLEMFVSIDLLGPTEIVLSIA